MKYLMGLAIFIASASYTFFLNNANPAYTLITGLVWGTGATIATYLFLETKKYRSKDSVDEETEFNDRLLITILNLLGFVIFTAPNFYNLNLDYWYMLKFLILGFYQLIVFVICLYVLKKNRKMRGKTLWKKESRGELIPLLPPC